MYSTALQTINLMSNKQISQHFLTLAAKGEAKKAFQLYAGESFKHHNAYFKGDAETLMEAMDENARQNPALTLDIQRTLEDGELVAVHSHIKQNADDLGASVIHILRFEGDKIAELWDIGQSVPAGQANENGMF